MDLEQILNRSEDRIFITLFASNVHRMNAIAQMGLAAGRKLVIMGRSLKSYMESAIETSASSIRQFFKGLDGTIHVAFEEGTQAAWLYDVIRPLVTEVTVCDPRRNKLIQSGNKGDRIDAAKLTRLLRLGELHAVYHGERGTHGLKELVHGYESLVADTTRTKSNQNSWSLWFIRAKSLFPPLPDRKWRNANSKSKSSSNRCFLRRTLIAYVTSAVRISLKILLCRCLLLLCAVCQSCSVSRWPAHQAPRLLSSRKLTI